MSLESGTYIGDLVPTNPPSSDLRSQGDDHLRLLKSTLQNTFPNASRAFYFPDVAAKSTAYSIVATDQQKTVTLDTASADIDVTLPSDLGTADAGWRVRVMKTSTDANQVRVAKSSGTINGLTFVIVVRPYVEYEFLWTGTDFVRPIQPGEHAPGEAHDYPGATLPVGAIALDGQSLVRTEHPGLFAAWGTTYGAADATHFNAPDRAGRAAIGVGGTTASRIDETLTGLDGDTVGEAGGSDGATLTQENLPDATLAGAVAGGQGSHFHVTSVTSNTSSTPGGAFNVAVSSAGNTQAAVLPALVATAALGGNDEEFSILPPVQVTNIFAWDC